MCGVVMRSKHSIRIPEGLWEAVKVKAASEHLTVTAVIVEALKNYIKE
jgi:predicted DNA binding CopG/RHH family protein